LIARSCEETLRRRHDVEYLEAAERQPLLELEHTVVTNRQPELVSDIGDVFAPVAVESAAG